MRENVLYAIPTLKCNLSCNHCNIYKMEEYFNKGKFLNVLNSFEGTISLFGGEPTNNIPRLFEIIDSNKKYGKSKINLISTNLLILNKQLLDYYKSIYHLSTSWNPNRFNDIQYNLWIHNLKILNENNINYSILITLTKDLIDIEPSIFINKIKEFIFTKYDIINFEQLISDDIDDKHYERVDEWLCKLYKIWDIDCEFTIKNELDNWYFDCDNFYTLYPDGNIFNMCPHGNRFTIAPECMICDNVSSCRPCRLIKYCSYPKKLNKLIKGDIM